MTDKQIKKLSTHRLLNIFRQTRQNIWGREPEREWNIYDEEEDLLFIKLKAELDTREHIPRKRNQR